MLRRSVVVVVVVVVIVVVHHFQKSSPLKLLGQSEPNFMWSLLPSVPYVLVTETSSRSIGLEDVCDTCCRRFFIKTDVCSTS